MNKIYIVGSMRNPRVPHVAIELRERIPGVEFFDEWYASGYESDDKWKEYEKARGRGYLEALKGAHAVDVFEFDKHHLDTSDAVVLVAPAGRSAHLETGYMVGTGKPAYVLLDSDADRWDIMYQFCTSIHFDINTLIEKIIRDINGY